MKGSTVPIFRTSINTDEFSLSGTLKRHQFPLKVCYAITINKSQGQTLKRVRVYLLSAPFVHGYFYVAISRVGSREGLKIVVIEGPTQGRRIRRSGLSLRNTDIYTQNPVYHEVLRGLYL